MKILSIIVGVLVLGLAAFSLYARLAPVDAARWHLPAYPKDVGDYPSAKGFQAVREIDETPEAALAAVDAVAMSTPRTTRLAGSVEEGMITYVTRSRLMGFPDLTSVSIGDGGTLVLDARARFGESDLGVNRARVEMWLAEAGIDE